MKVRLMIGAISLMLLGGCASGWLADWTPAGRGEHSTTYRDGTTYYYPARDPRHSVEQYRPDLWNRFMKRR